MTQDAQTGQRSAIPDRDYLLIRFIDMALSNAVRCDTYITAAERDGDTEFAELCRRFRDHSRADGEAGKTLLAQRLHLPRPAPCVYGLPTHADM